MPLVILGALIITLCIAGLLEYHFHLNSLKSIPLRIHVNGTRGKSSVTRLIAAGLREGGLKTFAKKLLALLLELSILMVKIGLSIVYVYHLSVSR